MEFYVLGPLLVRPDGDAAVGIGAAKPRAVLGVLLIHANEVVSVDRLLEEVWGDDLPAGGPKTLRYHVSKLRDALQPDRHRGEEGPVATVPGGYVLHLEPDQLDAWRFEALAKEGSAALSGGRFGLAGERLAEALDLWRGGAFQDFAYDDFARGEIARLEELRLVCLEDRVAADLGDGRHRAVLPELQGLVREFPLRERFWSQLMVALYRSDQQAEALAAHQQARRVLGEQLGIEPNAALRHLEEQILLEELPLDLPRGTAVPTHNLPARTSVFIGRRDESAQVESLVGEHRLVTLTGAGGVGKTSLAVEVARALVDVYADGVWLVELASLSAPDQVVAEIGRLFDVAALPPRPYVDLVLDALASRQLLLILDNCEHLVYAAAAVGDALLRACPGLRILATSRELLHIAGEQLWSVPPLAVPPDDLEISVAAAREVESVALFVERAGEARASFELDASNVDEVAALCRRLDGIPLALEFAAARIAVLSPRQILDRLDDRFALLTHGPQTGPKRQQTLRATMEWSHDLLSIEERTLLRRLSVFHGGFTLEAVEAICSDELLERVAVLDLVGRLVDTSLLTVQAGAPVRYDMLDTVRHYALERLGSTVEAASLQRRHAEYYAALATPGEADRFSGERGEQYRKLASEEVNLRAALEWALDNGEADLLLRMSADLCVYWFANNRQDETLFWVPRALEVSSSEPTQQRAEVLYAVGIAYAQRSMLKEALAAAEELARIAGVLGDAERASDAIFVHWISVESTGDLEGARRLAEEQVRLLRRVDHPQVSFALFGAALLSVRLGDVAGASRLADEAEDRAARLSQARILAMVIGVRGSIAHARGDLAGAERLLSQAVGEFRRLGWIPPQTDFLGQLAAVSIAGGKLEQAETWARDLRELAEVLPEYDEKVESMTLLARVALLRDQVDVARALLDEALEIATDTGNRLGVALLLAVIAQVAWAAGDAERATMFHAGAAHLQHTTGYIYPAPRAREIERERADIQSSIGRAAYEAAWAIGEAMNQNELIENAEKTLALESPLGPDVAASIATSNAPTETRR